MKRKNNRPRRLCVESLEKREVLTAYINELMFDPFIGSTVSGQYVELRGEPNATIDPGTYLLVISDDNRSGTDPGVVNGIFDLSGQKWGSNGLLVLLPQDSPYSLGAGLVAGGPAPTILQSTAPGFGALPGDIYTDLFSGSDSLNSLAGSASFFLIQSSVAPKLGDDIDADNNGTIDVGNPALAWNVQDSLSLHDEVFSGPVAYGQIAFIQRFISTDPPVATPAGTRVVYTEGFGYAARIGDSTGHSLSDWVAGTARGPASGQTSPYYRFENGIFGVPEPYVFTGRELDHLGESNFVASIRGTVSETIVNDTGQNEVIPVPGVRFLADTNGNGTRDVLTDSYDPDSFPVGAELTNVYPGVTLTTVNASGDNIGYEIESELQFQSSLNPTANRVFSQIGIPYFTNNSRLRIDFYQPAKTISIDAMGLFTLTPTVARLEAFNAAGDSLGFIRSRALFSSTRQTIRLNFGENVIAYALAYSDSTSTGFVQFDDLEVGRLESTAVTDTNGQFTLNHLPADDYSIVPFTDPNIVFATPLPSTPVSISRYQNVKLDFSVQLNAAPQIQAATFSIDEDAAVDSPVGTVVATDKDLTQTIGFSIQNAQASAFRIDPLTGQLFVRTPSAIDFESNPLIAISVIATDTVGGTSTKDVFVQLRDVNEAPQVTVGQYFVSEEADNNSSFGRVNAFDPEAPDVAPKFEITGGSGASVFSIEESTGVLRVANADLLDFESVPAFTLNVAVSDHSVPPLTKNVVINIGLTNANDAPVITSESFDVTEGLPRGTSIGTILFTEPDLGQTHTFRLTDDSDGRFRIEASTGIVSLVDPLDFETSATHEIVVQVVDNGTPPQGTSKTIVIHVLNVNEPATLSNSNFIVQENSPSGTTVGTLVAGDPEGVVGLTFASIDTSNPTLLFGGRVSVDPVTGRLTVTDNAILDADGGDSILSDRVQILDGTTIVGEALLKLFVINTNEAPVIASQQRLGLPLGLPSGRVFAQIAVSDPEKDQVTLSVIGKAATQFGIDANNRMFVLPGVVIDFTSDPEIDVEIRATDAQGKTSTGTVTVTAAPLPRFGTAIANQSFASGTRIDFTLPPQYRTENIRSVALTGPDNKLPEGLRFDPVIARLSGIAAPSANGTVVLTVQVSVVDGDAVLLKEETFNFTVTRPNRPLLNSVNSLDVDGNGRVEAIDALRVINFLARAGNANIEELADIAQYFYDTNGSNSVSAVDALLVINHLSRVSRITTASAESTFASVDNQDTKAKTIDDALVGYMNETAIF